MPPPDDKVLVGQILRAARRAADLGQDEVAEATGIKQQHVSRLERGVCPSPAARDLVRLAELLDIDIADLTEPFRTPVRGRRRQLAQVAS